MQLSVLMCPMQRCISTALCSFCPEFHFSGSTDGTILFTWTHVCYERVRLIEREVKRCRIFEGASDFTSRGLTSQIVTYGIRNDAEPHDQVVQMMTMTMLMITWRVCASAAFVFCSCRWESPSICGLPWEPHGTAQVCKRTASSQTFVHTYMDRLVVAKVSIRCHGRHCGQKDTETWFYCSTLVSCVSCSHIKAPP